MTWLLFVGALLTIVATGCCQNKNFQLGCNFQNFKDLSIDIPRGQTHAWGEVTPMVFESKKKVNEFREALNRMKTSRIKMGGSFNDLNILMGLNQNRDTPKNTYSPLFSSSRQDNLALLYKFHSQLQVSQEWPNAAKHFYVAAASMGIPQDMFTEQMEQDGLPNAFFEINHLVGLFEVVIEEKSRARDVPARTVGYILIDFEYNLIPPVIYDNALEAAEGVSYRQPIAYGRTGNYISVYDYNFQRQPRSLGLVYVASPLCSLMKAVNHMLWTTPVRKIVKFNDQTNAVQAFVFAKIFNNPQSIFGQGSKDFFAGYASKTEEVAQSIAFDDYDYLNEHEKKFFESVAKNLGLTSKDLQANLRSIQSIKYHNAYQFENVQSSVKPIERWVGKFLPRN